MANKKSALKRIRQTQKRRLHNRHFRGRTRKFIASARLAIQGGNLEEARTETLAAVKAIDKAAQKGIIHQNNAGRRKSRLMKSLAALEKQAAE